MVGVLLPRCHLLVVLVEFERRIRFEGGLILFWNSLPRRDVEESRGVMVGVRLWVVNDPSGR